MALLTVLRCRPRRLVTCAVLPLVGLAVLLALGRLKDAVVKQRVPTQRTPSASASAARETGVDHRDGFEDVEREMADRKQVYESVCNRRAREEEEERVEMEGVTGGGAKMKKKKKKGQRGVFVYPPGNISFCRVPKVGVTFWKQIFLFLCAKKNHWKTPSDMPRMWVHSHMPDAPCSGNQTDEVEESSDSKSQIKRFMFTRDPWTRLWSAYVDKFVLPDSWTDHGVHLMYLRKTLAPDLAARLRLRSQYEIDVLDFGPETHFLTNESKDCADDVSFGEFLHYAFEGRPNSHWKPVSEVCDPCRFRPHYLGKLETFSRDTAFILNSAGLGALSQDHQQEQHQDHPQDQHQDTQDHQHHGTQHVHDELRLLTEYHFHLWKQRSQLHGCLTFPRLAARLWAAFQLNGYIPLRAPFPREELTSRLKGATREEAGKVVIKEVVAAHDAAVSLSAVKGLDFGREVWAVRRAVLVGAYRSLPPDLLSRVQEVFRTDFDLFQYDSQPSDIFSTEE